jgi:hypothetical protein
MLGERAMETLSVWYSLQKDPDVKPGAPLHAVFLRAQGWLLLALICAGMAGWLAGRS